MTTFYASGYAGNWTKAQIDANIGRFKIAEDKALKFRMIPYAEVEVEELEVLFVSGAGCNVGMVHVLGGWTSGDYQFPDSIESHWTLTGADKKSFGLKTSAQFVDSISFKYPHDAGVPTFVKSRVNSSRPYLCYDPTFLRTSGTTDPAGEVFQIAWRGKFKGSGLSATALPRAIVGGTEQTART